MVLNYLLKAKIRHILNLLALCLVLIILIGSKDLRCGGGEDADIIVYVERDWIGGCKPHIDYAKIYLAEMTRNVPDGVKEFEKKDDETSLNVPDKIDDATLNQLCEDHDNLSQDQKWWCYIVGIYNLEYSGRIPYGKSFLVGDPYSAWDNDHSGVSYYLIWRDCEEEDRDEAVMTVVAHELFHQFQGVNTWHCDNPECIMHAELNTHNPQNWLCGVCQNLLKDYAP